MQMHQTSVLCCDQHRDSRIVFGGDLHLFGTATGVKKARTKQLVSM